MSIGNFEHGFISDDVTTNPKSVDGPYILSLIRRAEAAEREVERIKVEIKRDYEVYIKEHTKLKEEKLFPSLDDLGRCQEENTRLKEVVKRYLTRVEYDWDSEFRKALQ